MLFNPFIHPARQLVKAVIGRLEKNAGFGYDTNELVVLNYHSTPKKFIAEFEKQVDFLKENFHIISPKELRDYYNGDLHSDKCCLLFTFDDGLKNNLHALSILEQKGFRAFVFAVPDFIDCAPDQQSKFYQKNIRPIINTHIDSQTEDTSAMSWDDVRQLIAKGHEVGCHTLTHTLNIRNSTPANSEQEIVKSKTILEKELNAAVESFCSINNTLMSVGSFEKALIQKNYRFHFTTLPGSNAADKDPLFIRRRNVEAYWLRGAFYFAIGQRDLPRWKEKIETYRQI